jgi:hypothetical protein
MEKNMATQTAPARLTADPTENSGGVRHLSTPVAPANPTQDPAVAKTEDPGPLWAAHAPNFPALLRELGASVLVTTYRAGKLAMIRDEGDHLNIVALNAAEIRVNSKPLLPTPN